MAILNNVNVGMLERVTREAATDKSKVKRTQKINGEWLWEEGGPQCKAEIHFEGGKLVRSRTSLKTWAVAAAVLGPCTIAFLVYLPATRLPLPP